MSDTPASWHPDPTGAHDHRYWDGTQWTEHVADAGVASIDPHEAAPAPTADEPATPEPATYEPATYEPARYEPAAPEPAADEPRAHEPSAYEVVAPEPAVDEPAVDDPADADPVSSTSADEPWAVAPALEERWPLLPEAGDELPPEVEPLAPVDPTVVTPVFGDTDPTTTWPTTSAVAAAWAASPDGPDAPAPPPPYVPGEPDSSGGASKRRLAIGGGILAAVAVVAIAVVAFGGGDDSPKTNASANGGTSTTGPAPDGSYGSDATLDALYDSCDDGDYAACDQLYTDSDPGSEYESFGDTCGNRNEPGGYCVDIYGANSDEGSDTTAPGSTPATGIDPSELPDDFEKTLADTYQSTLNLDRDQAECLSGKVTDAITSGSLGENQAMSEFMKYFSDCDISLEEIGAK